MTHLYVWHDSLYLWHDSLKCVAWLIQGGTRLILDGTCEKNDPFIRVTWPIHTWDTTHSYVWHDPFIRWAWLMHMCDMAHSYMWHDSSIMRDMTPGKAAAILIFFSRSFFTFFKVVLQKTKLCQEKTNFRNVLCVLYNTYIYMYIYIHIYICIYIDIYRCI